MDNKPAVTSVEQLEQIELLEQQTGTDTEDLLSQESNGTPADLQHDPADAAAVFFSREKPMLKSLLNGMSVKQIRRFVIHVASYPLLDAGDVLQSEEEKRAAYLFGEMVWNRVIMQMQVEMEKTEAAMKQRELEHGQAARDAGLSLDDYLGGVSSVKRGPVETNKQATDVAEGSIENGKE